MPKLIPVFRVFDYDKTIEFYISWLGATITWEHKPVGAPFFMEINLKDCAIYLSEHHGECSPGGLIIFNEFTGLTNYHQQLQAKQYPYYNPGLEKVDWDPNSISMKVTDPFYNRIEFTEKIA